MIKSTSRKLLELASNHIASEEKKEVLQQGIINGNQILYIAGQCNAESDKAYVMIMFDKTAVTTKEE